jgi:hypothetical protein
MATEKKPESLDIEITVFKKSGGALTKRIGLAEDGSLVRDGSECRMSKGWAHRAPITDLHVFAAKLMRFHPYEGIALGALCDGLPDKVKVVTKDKLDGHADTIARTKDSLVYRADRPALVLLDFDRDGMPSKVARRLKDFWQALVEVLPALHNAAHVIRASTSSGLSRSDTGDRLPDSGGWHGYVVVRDGTDAERFLATLHDRCWLNGLGWIKLGAAGQKLERSIIDRMVAAPERLVFEAPPILEKPLKQDQESRRPIVREGEILDTLAVCPVLTPKEQKAVAKLKAEAWEQIEPEAQGVRAAYVEKNAQELAARTGISIEAAVEQISNRCRGMLMPDDILPFTDRKLEGCTVADVLADPKRFEGRTLADPIEGISYGRSTAIVMLRRSDGHPWIKSFAHGGMSYSLNSGADVGVGLKNFYAYMPMHNYIFAPTREHWPAESVNARISPIPIGVDSDGEEITIKASTWIDQNQPVEQMTWTPGAPMVIKDWTISEGGWIERKGVSCFNLYRAPTIKLGDASKAKRWVKLVHKVFPDDADHLIKWFAHRRQRPWEKINHALVVGSKAQGVGKDTTLEGLKRAVGAWNFKEVAPKNIFDSFNPWRRAVVLRVSEAKDMGDVTRFELYDAMKTLLVTPPDVIDCNEKYIKHHYVTNCMGIVVTTNHLTDGIYLPAEDRRHYVAWSDCEPADFAQGFWIRFWKWYDDEGGDGHVAAYLDTLDISDFDPKAPPPKTPAFWSIVNANRTTEEAELQDILDMLDNPDAVTLAKIMPKAGVDFGQWLTERKNRKAVNHRLETCGYRAVNNPVAKDGLWRINDRRQMVYAKTTLALGQQLKAAETLQRRAEEAAEAAEAKRRATEKPKKAGKKPIGVRF